MKMQNILTRMPSFKLFYGITELTAAVTGQDLNDPLDIKMNTVGKAVGHTEVRMCHSSPEI